MRHIARHLPVANRTFAFAASLFLFFVQSSYADATTITMSTGFESPVFSVGPIGGNPPFTQGQGGWGGFNAASISNAQAHSGTQSLKTSNNTSGLGKALDPSAADFSVYYGQDWFVQAWVRINTGGSIDMALVNGLGGCPLLEISASGVPLPHGCLTASFAEPSLGNVANKWLLLQMVHAGLNQQLSFSITGAGVNWQHTLPQYSGPGSGNPAYLSLNGDAYWDDIKVGYGAVPLARTSVPEPASALLMGLGLIAFAGVRRKQR